MFAGEREGLGTRLLDRGCMFARINFLNTRFRLRIVLLYYITQSFFLMVQIQVGGVWDKI